MLINMSVFGQTLPDSTYYINSSSGTLSVTGSAYMGIRTKAWVINIGTQTPVKIDFDVDVVENADFIDIYTVTASGGEHLMLTLTGTKVGSISTVLPTGKAKIRFRMNTTWGGNYYDGLIASYSHSEDNLINTSVSDNAYVDKEMFVFGNVGIGTASMSGRRLSISGTNQYGIYSALSNTSRPATYGIYSTVSSSGQSASIYGLYSTVSGTATNKWAGYFTGGTVEVNGGVLKANSGLIVGDSSALFNGNVGIGTTSPISKLDVRGSVYLPSGQSYWIGSNADSGNRLRLHHAGSAGYIDYAPSLYFRSGATNVMFLGQNGNIGIGTTSPAYKLDVSGVLRTTGNALFNGNVGIGTTSPAYKLDVNGVLRTTGNALVSGNVGIGTTSPAYKLDVSGIIRATEVKIETGGADFVFSDDYHLKPLPEVESFIKANKHLPEIPSAAEMKENEGMGIGEMQTKLLQKIEELTLYLIQQENTIRELKSEIRELKEK
jgi:hypothetical protein